MVNNDSKLASLSNSKYKVEARIMRCKRAFMAFDFDSYDAIEHDNDNDNDQA